MTTPGLIKKVVEATGMTLCSPNKTPTSQTALQILKDLQSRKTGSIHLLLECYFISLQTQGQILPLQSVK